jgi:NADH-quinone oxidoreductase subunit J
VKALADALFSRYLLPFEATSILLVVAVVGVMVLARRISYVQDTARPRRETREEEAA